jgi:hypothetical protein
MADGPDMLLEEYKLIQGKIDKLGEDKFKVRSWCFTIVAGILAGAKLSGALTDSLNSFFLLLIFVPIIVAFQFVELKQRRLANWLGLRALEIEKQWKPNPHAPQLAGFIIRRSNKEGKHSSLWKWLTHRRGAAEPKKETRSQPLPLKDCLTARADMLFYAAQYLIVGIFMILWILNRFLGATTQEKGAMVVRLNNHEFAVGVRETNIYVTNFLQVQRSTTNYLPINSYTTNFIVIDLKVTNR